METFGRDQIPISQEAFAEIEAKAVTVLSANLSARKFVDVRGPFGWDYSGAPAGRVGEVKPDSGVEFGVRVVMPVVESRVNFELGIGEFRDFERGASDIDMTPLERAAIAIAAFEDKAVYRGLEGTAITGMKPVSWYPPLELPRADPEAFVRAISVSTYAMKAGQSIDGPYALIGGHALRYALGKFVSSRTLYEVLVANTDVTEFIFTPSYDGAYLVSRRGGDFDLSLGCDLTVGFERRDGDTLKLYIVESFAFRVLEPRAFRVLDLK
ncbi:MAG: bacteriocin family protein [Synergistaceae bacterium]|jgi:uncharacterized linocin/CFP29 family protein|nr:bacteriocin family protein [Synergistaceae bacterium]